MDRSTTTPRWRSSWRVAFAATGASVVLGPALVVGSIEWDPGRGRDAALAIGFLAVLAGPFLAAGTASRLRRDRTGSAWLRLAAWLTVLLGLALVVIPIGTFLLLRSFGSGYE
jgi:cytochrome bd-type quinol oxidase subunit 2